METQVPVELLAVDAVAPLDPAVMLGGPWPDELVLDADGREEGLDAVRVIAAVPGLFLPERPVGELAPVVRLEDPRGRAEERDRPLQRPDGLVHRMLRGEPEEPPPAELVQDGVLVEPPLQPRGLAFGRNELDVHLPLQEGLARPVVLPVVPPLGVRDVGGLGSGPLQDPVGRRLGDPEPGEPALEPELEDGVVGVPPPEVQHLLDGPRVRLPRVL